jgi:hypothetical protein
MRLTHSSLRSLLVNPTGFVAAVQSAVPGSPQYGNPQRRWIDGAITEYFKAGRDADVLWQAFDQRVQRGNMTPSREANAAGAVRLLDRFLEWDSKEVDVPADTFPPVRDVAIGPHVIAVRRDLIYIDPAGYRVRQLWTDHQLRPQHPVAVQMAAAVLVSVDADLGDKQTASVEVWGLRHGVRQLWPRKQLEAARTVLLSRLNVVASQLK